MAKSAKSSGATAASTAIMALRKPTLAAWLANLVVRTDPDGVNELTERGDELRAAHLSADGARRRELTPRRHDLVQALVRTARAHAKDRDRAISDSVADRLTETLDAALIDPGAAQLLRSGQLTSALRHVGFGVVDETGAPAKLAPMKPRTVRRAPAKSPAKPAPNRTTRSSQHRLCEPSWNRCRARCACRPGRGSSSASSDQRSRPSGAFRSLLNSRVRPRIAPLIDLSDKSSADCLSLLQASGPAGTVSSRYIFVFLTGSMPE
jgi:hypothetical protein